MKRCLSPTDHISFSHFPMNNISGGGTLKGLPTVPISFWKPSPWHDFVLVDQLGTSNYYIHVNVLFNNLDTLSEDYTYDVLRFQCW